MIDFLPIILKVVLLKVLLNVLFTTDCPTIYPKGYSKCINPSGSPTTYLTRCTLRYLTVYPSRYLASSTNPYTNTERPIRFPI